MTAFQPITEKVRTVSAELHAHRLFLLIAPFLYFAYALITPPFQTPDEHQHLFRAWQLSQLQLVGQRRGDQSGGVLPASLGQAALPEIGSLEPHVAHRPIVQRSFTESFGRSTPLNGGSAPRFYDFRGAVIYSPAGYMPQIGAIWLGQALNLSIENIVRLGRLLNAALAIFLIYCALRLTPVGGLAILLVALLPMTAAASAAFGQDGLVIGGSCLVTAAGLRMALKPRQASDVIFPGAVAILLTLSKMFYLPLALVGGQPFIGKRLQAQRLWPSLVICFIAAALAGCWLHLNSRAVVPPWPDIPSAGQRLASWSHHPLEFPGFLERTYIDHGPDLLKSLFALGWLNLPVASAAVFSTVMALGLVFMAGDPAAAELDLPTRLWLIGLVLTVPLLLSLVAWLYWTPLSMDRIPGLQGRYFIPIAPALLIAILPSRTASANVGKFVPALMIAANLVALTSIVRAFYTF